MGDWGGLTGGLGLVLQTVRLIEEIFKNRGAEVMNQLRLLGLSDEQVSTSGLWLTG